MDVPSFAKRLKDTRRQREWSQRELAARVGLSLSQVQSLEQGRRSPGRETAHRLALALGAELDAPAYGSDDQYLADLYRLAIELHGPGVGGVRRDTARLITKYESVRHDEAHGLLAKAHLAAGVSYQEAELVPPPIAFEHLRRAQGHATRTGDWHLHSVARWYEASLHRKHADIAHATSSYARARRLLDAILTDGRVTSPWVQVLAFSEQARLALSDVLAGSPRDETAFWGAIRDGMRLVEHSSSALLPLDGDAFWSTFWPARSRVILLNVYLYGAAHLGSPSTRVRELAELMRRDQASLTELIEKVTMNYALGQALLAEGKWAEGVQLVLDAMAFARARRFSRQSYNGMQILRTVRRKLPSSLPGTCSRCREQRELIYFRGREQLRCRTCGAVVVSLR